MVRSLVFCVVLSLFASGCATNNVTVDNSLQQDFDSAGVRGSFALFDNGHGHFRICNLSRFSDSFYTPGGTFDIMLSLIAIQIGVLKDDHSKLGNPSDPLQGGVRIHSPVTLGECFRDTSEAGELGFEELGTKALRVDTLKKWIDSLQYGNKTLGDSQHPVFWENGALTINGDQQLGLLKKLYFGQLPFFHRTQEIVRGMFSTENNSAYRLSYKLAQTPWKDGRNIGWAMGWIEENKHPYFFVVNLESADPQKDLRQTGLALAKKILDRLGFFHGLK